MKITTVKTYLVHERQRKNFIFVKLETDEGIAGWGEAHTSLDMDTAVAAHLAGTRARADQAGVPLTYLAYVVKALVEPLQRFPLLNASLDDNAHEVVLKRYYHVGIATATAEP